MLVIFEEQKKQSKKHLKDRMKERFTNVQSERRELFRKAREATSAPSGGS